jgi:hypothetical protein
MPIVTNDKGGSQSYIKHRFDLIPPETLLAVSAVLSEGAEKYGEWNWMLIDTNDHLNHALTHIYKFLSDDNQEDHLHNAICRLIFAAYTHNYGDKE